MQEFLYLADSVTLFVLEVGCFDRSFALESSSSNDMLFSA